MRTFASNGACPKCGYDASGQHMATGPFLFGLITTVWVPQEQKAGAAKPEDEVDGVLWRGCPRCRYRWRETPLDEGLQKPMSTDDEAPLRAAVLVDLKRLETSIGAVSSRSYRYKVWSEFKKLATDRCYEMRGFQCEGCSRHVSVDQDACCNPPDDGGICLKAAYERL
jgi:hypothetical protein